MSEPQLSFLSLSSGGRNTTALDLGVQLGYLATPAERNSTYVAANAAWQTLSTGGGGYSQNGLGLGGAVGYRMRGGAGFAGRLEALYSRWLRGFNGLNGFRLRTGLGGGGEEEGGGGGRIRGDPVEMVGGGPVALRRVGWERDPGEPAVVLDHRGLEPLGREPAPPLGRARVHRFVDRFGVHALLEQ